jgi:DNA-binding IclR family transcriptional regulator
MAESPTRVLIKLRAVLDCFVPDNRPLTPEAARRGVSLVSIARPSMEELRDVTGETVTLLVREGLRRVCVELVPSRHAVSQNVVPGEVHPLQAGSPSKVLLAWDTQATEQLLAAGLKQLTESTITDPVVFRRELSQVIEQGYATSFGENVDGVASISAPIFDGSARIAAALCVGGPSARITPEFVTTQRAPLVNTARRVSRMLGWRGDPAGEPSAEHLPARLAR